MADQKYDAALDEYMKCLVALDFKTCKGTVSDEQGDMAAVAVKIPVLNNMALCLFK